jgi:hypothetical protein
MPIEGAQRQPSPMRPNYPDSHVMRGFGPMEGAAADAAVGEVPQGLSDEQREAAIERASKALCAAHERVMAGGGFEAAGDRERALALFYALVRGRSAAQVARMERERGLA